MNCTLHFSYYSIFFVCDSSKYPEFTIGFYEKSLLQSPARAVSQFVIKII